MQERPGAMPWVHVKEPRVVLIIPESPTMAYLIIRLLLRHEKLTEFNFCTSIWPELIVKRFPARAVRGLRWAGKRRLLRLRLEFFTASDSARSRTCFTAGNTGCIDIAVVASHVGPHRHLCFVIIQGVSPNRKTQKKKNSPSRCSLVNVYGTQWLAF